MESYFEGRGAKDRRWTPNQARWSCRRVALVLAGALAVACAGPVSPPPDPSVRELYRVGASDRLTIQVLPDPAIERVVVVRPDGQFSMDLIGDVRAEGRRPEEIAAEIEERMAEYRQSPSVLVSLDAPTSNAVAVLGEVNQPVLFPLERETRVSEAVARAGGMTELAAASRVRVIRKSGEETLLFLTDLDDVQAGRLESDLHLRRGDLIYVPPAVPVSAGYALRRALFPLEILFRTIAGPLLGLLAAQ